ncbi:MAG: HEPN domain-containing protein [Actinomycetia bacterium]|nr:HEPN domain-containing protein [Actinomycetota bacterium]MBU4483095.1 HEPN domain-containing protein [Actinomycetota bacterium]MCG2790283.1 HEPN domain-containing protein [Actinomycetes bacterium]
MSQENYKEDSIRWLRQAKADIKAAQGSTKNNNYEWACFQSQQAAEKALKALWYFYSSDPWGHSVVKLIQEFPQSEIKKSLNSLLNKAKELDKLYIPTRYPNSLPDLTPSEVYTEEEASKAIESSKIIIKEIEVILKVRS